MKTIQQLAKDALNVQNASNLSGVVHSFSQAFTDLRALYPGKGTDWFNQHPIVKLWSDKVGHLAGTQSFDWDSSTAYRRVNELVEKGETDY